MVRTKILVVDQEARAYEPLKSGLSAHGYEIHTSTTTPQALSLAGAHDYKAALVSLALTCDEKLLTGLNHELPDLSLIIVCSSEVRCIPSAVFAMADNAMGKPLGLDPVRLMLDRTLELAVLRSRLRQERQGCGHIWMSALSDPASAAMSAHEGVSLDDLLVHKLRMIVPNMEMVGRGMLYRAVLSYVEKLLLTIVLTECRGNQVKSADILGINRNTLRKKLREFGVTFSRRHAE
jgi:DNA-binding protein Fis